MLVSRSATNILLVLILAIGIGIVAMLATGVRGGPLDPPGAPASTDGVRDAGTPISSLPFAITQPGYYYVTRDLSGPAGQPGITIAVSNVTVDLGGFTLTGGASPGDGISNPGARNIVIRNGSVRAWSHGINLGGAQSRVEHIQAISNTVAGIRVGPQSEISDCNASVNFNGIELSYASVRRCTVAENTNSGITTDVSSNDSLLEGNRVNNNQGYGVDIYGTRNLIRDNQISGNVAKDVVINFDATLNVLTGNLYCTAFDFGSGTVSSGNTC